MKNTRNITSYVLGVTTVTSIALSLHFNSLAEDYKNSHIKLNAKYTDVLVENGELRDSNISLNNKNIVLYDAAEKSSGLLEQSQMEIERLNKETKALQGEVKKQKGQVDVFKQKVSVLEKKTDQPHVVASKSYPSPIPVQSAESDNGEWMNFRLTYYDNQEQSTGKNPGDSGYGLTASGRPTTEGVSIAVDTDIIPLGTWVLIKWPDGRTEKRRADDTGSAINGYDLDYYVPKASLTMGDSNVAVKILSNM
jgi:3D (Asp-Asp-Asp) domain-containing protein/polyhydroxyalkanoate synthesis regulator phasin